MIHFKIRGNMSISHYDFLKRSGEKTLFLLNSSGIIVFPVIFTHCSSVHYTQPLEFIINFDLFLDVENLISIKYSYYQKNSYCSEKNPRLSMHVHPLYEYGNEEEFLPEISQYKNIWTERELLLFIGSEINQYCNSFPNTYINKKELAYSFLLLWNSYKNVTLDNSSEYPELSLDIIPSLGQLFNKFLFFKEQQNIFTDKIKKLKNQ